MTSDRLRIASVGEIEFLKRFTRGGTLGGIEVAYRSLVKGLRARGHLVLENRHFTPGKPPHLVICPTFGPLSVARMWWWKKKYHCACVQIANTTPEDMKGGFIPDFLVPVARWYMRKVYEFSEILVTPTTFSKVSLKGLQLRTRPPIEVISNGVDLTRFMFDEEKRVAFKAYLSTTFNVDGRAPVILCVSVLWKRKGIEVFHALARAFPGWTFIWVGNYLTTRKLKDAYDTLPNLKFTGFVDDVVAAYCGADVFVFPSHSENEGLPLLEAAACKLPILCRDIPTYDWMQHDVHCLKERTLPGFKRSLKQLVDDPALQERLRSAAFDNVLQHGAGTVLDKVERVYHRAMRLHQARSAIIPRGRAVPPRHDKI